MSHKVVKKDKYVFGNKDYPYLKHFPEYVIFQKGRYRITEKTYEYLERMYGYQPTPELAVRRRIQVKVLFFWWYTLAEQAFRVDTMKLIRASCFAERYDYEPHWIKVGFGEEVLDELIQKDKNE